MQQEKRSQHSNLGSLERELPRAGRAVAVRGAAGTGVSAEPTAQEHAWAGVRGARNPRGGVRHSWEVCKILACLALLSTEE